jgi:Flp pilus assembly protein TadD
MGPQLARVRALLDAHRPEQALGELARLPADIATSPDAFRLRTGALLELERWPEAADAARLGLATGGPDADLLGQLGAALHHIGDLPGAERALLDALALDPSDVWLLCRYAQLCLGAGQTDKAARLLDRAAAQNPHAAVVYATRVQLEYARGDDRATAQAAEAFLAAYPDHPVALAMHGQTASRRGQTGPAYRSFRRAAAENPTDTDYASAAWEARVWNHPLLRPLRPLHRLGMIGSWLVAVGVIYGLRAIGLRPLATLFAVGWFCFCIYSWVMPPLVRRFLVPRRPPR